MKIKLTALATITLLSAALSCPQPAAAEGRGARFDFAPNVWKQEANRPVAKSAAPEPIHSVKNGSVPQGSNFLGLDPQMLKPAPKPVAPQPQMQVAASPSFAQATPQMAVPKVSFNSAFGKPAGQIGTPGRLTPVVASAPVAQPPLPQVATARSLQAAKPAARVAGKRSGTQASRTVSGKLRRPQAPKAPAGMVARAGKGVDSYGKNFGYVPGPYLPAVAGDGLTAQADVHGRLIRR